MISVNPATVVDIPFKNKTTNWQYTQYVRIEKVVPPVAPVAKLRALRQ